ncbi:M23 family metallopeptidase [Myxosarcina sp. GI1]|uniref:M23 family metallopeptidase n=1 Tax=Myxosarcina sp. GI1 TaxID=1541065 RepID=UPI000568A456|nr:M23 family metallopeptidase [Myxosarcina sp. GI1]
MIYIFKKKWYRLLVVGIATLLLIGFESICSNAIQASTPPKNVSESQNASAIWQQGSFPVENFQSYTSPFGYRISPIDGKPQFHNGLDLAAPRGSYIRSWWSGKVTKVSDNTNCGTSITIESGTWKHSYCHLEGHVERDNSGIYMLDAGGGIKIFQGQEVPAGARIGRIGMTGNTTGPHLHWVLRYRGDYVDPALVLKEMFKRQTVSSIHEQ